jgi:pullulanase
MRKDRRQTCPARGVASATIPNRPENEMTAMRKIHLFFVLFLAAAGASATAEPVVSSATNRPALGREATPYLRFDSSVAPTNRPRGFWSRLFRSNPRATNVQVAGSWDAWTGRYDLAEISDDLWELDTRTLGARLGQHEFKFIVNGDWEWGANRAIPFNLFSEIERVPAIVAQATIEDFKMIRVHFKKSLPKGIEPTATLCPAVPVAWTEVVTELEDARKTGYLLSQGVVTFLFDEATYGLEVSTNSRVVVAGNFNGWDGGGGNAQYVLAPGDLPGVWESVAQLDGMRLPPGERDLVFKFVVDGQEWLEPPKESPNALPDGQGSVNLKLDLMRSGGAEIRVHTAEPLDLTINYSLRIDGVFERPIGVQTTPDGVFNKIYSDKPMGATLDKERNLTTYRFFAPRARNAWLCFFDRPMAVTWTPTFTRFAPVEEYRMSKDADGVWELTTRGLDVGRYYGFRVDGPEGDGEGFDAETVVGDPYGRAAATANGLTLVIDPDATNEWFRGWTDHGWKTPARKDAVIYECHVRGLTIDPSSGAPAAERGKFGGLMATLGKGAGLDHLKELGVNAIELLPISEFIETDDPYNWGYATVYYFAPESGYASDPLNGSAYYEFKQMVNDLHNEGFAVVLDVVYNHVGGPNIFATIDRKYYHRLNPDLSFSNHSACGHDLRTESPMLRKLIVDNIVYFMKEFRIDGFRLDLAELVDMETMLAIRDAAQAINPNVLLISEPWSPGRGENKYELRGTGWSAWNNDFRYPAKNFVRGWGNREWLREGIMGSVNTWAEAPIQPVNYVESHDDRALADELTINPDNDGRKLNETDAARNRLVATILYTSLGKPMIYEGQEFMRSKWGIKNTYNQGDKVNAVRWGDRDRPIARRTLDYYRDLIHLRNGEAGQSFRTAERPPEEYFHWILPENDKVLAYSVNASGSRPGRGFFVLLNAGDKEHAVPVELVGDSAWRQIGDGERIDPDGLRGAPRRPAGWRGEIAVPALSSVILMNGF